MCKQLYHVYSGKINSKFVAKMLKKKTADSTRYCCFYP